MPLEVVTDDMYLTALEGDTLILVTTSGCPGCTAEKEVLEEAFDHLEGIRGLVLDVTQREAAQTKKMIVAEYGKPFKAGGPRVLGKYPTTILMRDGKKVYMYQQRHDNPEQLAASIQKLYDNYEGV